MIFPPEINGNSYLDNDQSVVNCSVNDAFTEPVDIGWEDSEGLPVGNGISQQIGNSCILCCKSCKQPESELKMLSNSETRAGLNPWTSLSVDDSKSYGEYFCRFTFSDGFTARLYTPMRLSK